MRLCNFACNSKLHGSTLLFLFFSFFFCWQCLSSAYRSVIVTHLLLLLRAVGGCLQTGVELFIFQEGLFSIKVFSLTEASLAPVYRERERERLLLSQPCPLLSFRWLTGSLICPMSDITLCQHAPLISYRTAGEREGGKALGGVHWFVRKGELAQQQSFGE